MRYSRLRCKMIRIQAAFLFLIFIVPSVSFSDILFKNPDNNEMFNLYMEYNKYDLEHVSLDDDVRKIYIAATIFLHGDRHLGIKRNCDRSVELLNNLIEKEVADAGYTLSTMYYNGDCVDKNLTKARDLLEYSANNHYIPAERLIGEAYWNCISCDMKGIFERNIRKSIKWFEAAAKEGDIESANNLSEIYLKGDGVDKNLIKAFEWRYKSSLFTKSSNFDPVYLYKLAPFYEKGIGTDKDLVQAYKYYTLSGNAGAEGKHRVAEQMTPEQIQKGQRLANEWMQEHHTYVPNY